jgi:hypothetical protein
MPVPRNCSSAGPKSEEERPCRYSSGNTSATRGDLRAHAGRIAEENRCRSGGRVDALVADPRLPNRHRTRRRDHLPFGVVVVRCHDVHRVAATRRGVVSGGVLLEHSGSAVELRRHGAR